MRVKRQSIVVGGRHWQRLPFFHAYADVTHTFRGNVSGRWLSWSIGTRREIEFVMLIRKEISLAFFGHTGEDRSVRPAFWAKSPSLSSRDTLYSLPSPSVTQFFSLLHPRSLKYVFWNVHVRWEFNRNNIDRFTMENKEKVSVKGLQLLWKSFVMVVRNNLFEHLTVY